jgi:methionyl-tRNA formyltransferase
VNGLRDREPDLGVVVAFGQFIPRPVRELPRLGYLINAHASLLPRHRGAAPVARAILAGDRRTGISVMRVEREMDAGPVALVREIEIGPEENAGELSERLGRLAADAIAEAVERIEQGTITWRNQDAARATTAPKLEKAEGRLDWSQPAEALVRRVRALAPRPGAFSGLPREHDAATKSEPELLRILQARALPGHGTGAQSPGSVRRGHAAGEPALRIACGEGWLVPLILQRAGGRPMPVEDFLRGRSLTDGTQLVAPEAATDD